MFGLPTSQIENMVHNVVLWGLGAVASHGYFSATQGEVLASGAAALVVVALNIITHNRAINTPAPTVKGV